MRIESGEQTQDQNIHPLLPEKEKQVFDAFHKLSQDHLGQITLNPREFKSLTKEVYEALSESLVKASIKSCEGKELNKMYEYFLQKEEELIVRREIPDKVFDLVHNEKPLTVESGQLGFSDYPNCALFGGMSKDMQGLNNAFNEGWGEAGGVVLTIGFHKNDEAMTVVELENEETINEKERRDKVRSFTGEIKPEDLAFVVMRIPNSMNLTKKPNEGFYSFQGYIFNEDKNKIGAFFEANKKEASVYRKAS